MQAKRVDTAKQMRAIFDKVEGDWDKLDEGDKAQFVKLSGLKTEDLAKNWWVTMKYGLNGPPAGKGAGGPK